MQICALRVELYRWTKKKQRERERAGNKTITYIHTLFDK